MLMPILLNSQKGAFQHKCASKSLLSTNLKRQRPKTHSQNIFKTHNNKITQKQFNLHQSIIPRGSLFCLFSLCIMGHSWNNPKFVFMDSKGVPPIHMQNIKHLTCYAIIFSYKINCWESGPNFLCSYMYSLAMSFSLTLVGSFKGISLF